MLKKKDGGGFIELFVGIGALIFSFISLREVYWVYTEFGFEKAYTLHGSIRLPEWAFGFGMLIAGIYLILLGLKKLKK